MIHITIMQNLNPKFVLFYARKKRIKSDMFGRFENNYSDLHFLFLCRSEYKVFEVEYNIDYIQI
jgi:hypothetical protein